MIMQDVTAAAEIKTYTDAQSLTVAGTNNPYTSSQARSLTHLNDHDA